MALYWGPHFPDSVPGRLYGFWSTHFPDSLITYTVPPDPSAGGPLIMLVLENGTSLKLSWLTGVFKSYSGKERRSNELEDPKQYYTGGAFLTGLATLAERSRLARSAAQGATFLLGLPFEEVTVTGPAVGQVVPVASTDHLDWASPGQRCAVVANDDDGGLLVYQGVIQAVGTNSLTLDDGSGNGPGGIARNGARAMPLMTVLLDPQQGFDRYPTTDREQQTIGSTIERWKVAARASVFGFAGTPETPAFLSLEPPLTNSGVLDDVELYSLLPGADGNAIQVEFDDNSLSDTGELIEDVGAKQVTIRFSGGDTTVADLVSLIANSELIGIRGTYDPTDVLQAGDDDFDWTFLAGATSAAPAEMGKGATLTTYDGRPVWDRGIDVRGSAPDSLQSMSEIVDLGGVPTGIGEAIVPDWGRAIAMTRSDHLEWQWLKRFLNTVKGRWKTWWLPSYRDDLAAVSNAVPDELVISATIGDIHAWFPTRKDLMIVHEDDSVEYVRITDVVDAGATAMLKLSAALAASPITMVSWLELCRFESDEFTIGFDDASFSMKTDARVVQR